MKCIIYKIYKEGKDEVYIGSTTDFKRRMINHKSNCNNEKSKEYNCFIYQYIRQNGGWDEFNKEIIYECNVEDKYEKMKIEGEWIKKYEKTLNERNSYGCKDIKEYYEQNKDKIKEEMKEYYEKNKDKKKEYYEKNKDKKKEYYEQNKEKNKEEMKKYYEKNKDKIKENNKQKVNCIQCGKELSKCSLTRHIISKHTKEI